MKRKAIQKQFPSELPNDIWLVIVQKCMALHWIGLLLSIFATCRAAIQWILPSLHGFLELWKLEKSLLYKKCTAKRYTPHLYFALQWLYDSCLLSSQSLGNKEAIEEKKYRLVSEVLFAIQFSIHCDDSLDELSELPVQFLPSLQNVASRRVYYFSKDASRIKSLKNHKSLYEIDLKSASTLWERLPENTKNPKKKLLCQHIVKQKKFRSNRHLSYTLLQKYLPHKKATGKTKFRNLVLKEKVGRRKVLLQDHPLENRMFYLIRNYTRSDIKACSSRILYTLNRHNTKISIINGLSSCLLERT